MQNKEGFELQALPKPSSTAEIVTLDDMDFFLILHIPVYEDYKVYSIQELDNVDDNVFNIPDYMWRQEGISHIKINSAVLKRQPGYHQYRVNLVNTITESVKHLYFAYIVQSSRKDRDYIYMQDSREQLKEDK